MQQVIWRYSIDPVEHRTRKFEIMLPPSHVVRHVGHKQEELCVWIQRLAKADYLVPFYFILVETGQVFDPCSDFDYIGTASVFGDSKVYHVFKTYRDVDLETLFPKEEE